MPTASQYLYHVTTYEVAKRIIDDGYVDPKRSQGRQKVSWMVAKSKVSWAMAHVCHRHQCGIADLVVFTVRRSKTGTIKGSRRGIFASRLRLPIIEMASAAMWLSREEQYVHIPRRPKRRTNRNVYGTE